MTENKYYHPSDTTIDILVGASDGFSIPFFVVAGLYGASFPNGIIVFIATASAIVGGVVMLFTAFVTGRKQARTSGAITAQEKKIYEGIGLDEDVKNDLVDELSSEKTMYKEYVEEYELKASHSNKQILISAFTIGCSYTVAGLVPTIPFRSIEEQNIAIFVCCIVTLILMFLLGGYRAKITGKNVLTGALRLSGMGAVGAFAAYYVAGLLL